MNCGVGKKRIFQFTFTLPYDLDDFLSTIVLQQKKDPVRFFALTAAYYNKNLFGWYRATDSKCVIIVMTVSLILTRAPARSSPLFVCF